MNDITAMQARVLGCLIKKKETTPEQYPLTLNALRNACNQKTARSPVTQFSEGEVGHTVRELEALGLVREAWGARVAKYEHLAGKVLGLQSKGLALLCPMMLRGPQTLGELRTHAHRLYDFSDLEDVQYALRRLEDHEPPLVSSIPRQPGQKEERYAHLLCGEPVIPVTVKTHAAAAPLQSDLSQRIEGLELALEDCRDRLERLESRFDGDS